MAFHRLGWLAVIAIGSGCSAEPPKRHWERSAVPMSATTAPRSAAAQAGMIAIPAGNYPIGRDTGPASERPRHVVAIKAFRIDRTEVTNAAFAEYLNALKLPMKGSFGIAGVSGRNADAATVALLGHGLDGVSRYPIIELDDEDARIKLVNGRFQPAQGHADRPVTEVTWAGARAYCLWRGGELPSEAQWEAAARGKDDRVYPWGDAQADARRVVANGRTGATEPVGSKPAGASPFGVLDMAGSLSEWTRSLKRPYPYVAGDGREAIDAEGERTTRGGDYVYDHAPGQLRVSFRDGSSHIPERGHLHVGVRCSAT